MNLRALIAIVGGVLLLGISTFGNNWRTGTIFVVKARVGLREIQTCVAGKICVTMKLSRAVKRSRAWKRGKMFQTWSTLTFVFGILAGLALLGSLVAAMLLGSPPFPKVVFSVCGIAAVLALLTVVSWPGRVLGVGFGFWGFIVGDALGAYGLFALISGDDFSLLTARDIAVPVPPAPEATSRPARLKAEPVNPFAGVTAGDLLRKPDSPRTLAAPNSGSASGANSISSAAGSQPLEGQLGVRRSLIKTKELFDCHVIKEAKLYNTELHVSAPQGLQQTLAWTAIAAVAVRSLPVDPPYNGKLFLDFLPRKSSAGPGAPIRIVEESRLNYADLPGDGRGFKDNLRRLGTLIRAHMPSIRLDETTRRFFDEGIQPPRFASSKVLHHYLQTALD